MRASRGPVSVVLCFSLLIVLLSCGDKEGSSPVQPKLDLSPSLLDFGEEQEELTLSIRNRGSGILRWSVSDALDWLQVEPLQGETESEQTVLLRVDRSQLTAGSYAGSVQIHSDGGESEVQVAFVVHPMLEVDKNVLSFGPIEAELVFHLSNQGHGILEWNAKPGADWFQVVPGTGTASADPTPVRVLVDRSKVSPGQNTADLQVDSTGGTVTLAVLVEQPTGTTLYLGPMADLVESEFSEGSLWIRRISDTDSYWRYRFSGTEILQDIFILLTLSANQPCETFLTISLNRNGGEVISRDLNLQVDSRYPILYLEALEFDTTPIQNGDELVLSLSADEEVWVYLGGDPAKTSYMKMGR